MIHYGKQLLDQKDIDAVVEVLKSDHLTQGPIIRRLESAFENYCKVKFAVACSNGTAALHIACLAMSIGKDDIVWTVPNTFLASANCALYTGAKIDFVDIDELSFNISVSHLAYKLEYAAQRNLLPKALILVHFAGNPCKMNEISVLLKRYGVRLIEDASHALGASYEGEKIGSCKYSDLTIFSLHPVKSITAGEGGVLVTNDEYIAKMARLYACHGVTKDTEEFKLSSSEPARYEQQFLGFNYRLTDLQSALALSQLNKLDEYIEQRKYISEMYQVGLKGLPLKSQQLNGDTGSYNLFVVTVESEWYSKRNELFSYLVSSGITPGIHYIPVHIQPYYQSIGFREGDFPVAESYYRRTLSLPIYPGLPQDKVEFIVGALKQFAL